MRRTEDTTNNRWRLRAAGLAIASTLGACAIVPLDHHGEGVAISPAEAAVSSAIVTFGVLHFLGAFTHSHRGHWRGPRHHRGGRGRGGRRHRH